MEKALITGITGQDASYLAASLLDKGYESTWHGKKGGLEDPMHRMWRLKNIR